MAYTLSGTAAINSSNIITLCDYNSNYEVQRMGTLVSSKNPAENFAWYYRFFMTPIQTAALKVNPAWPADSNASQYIQPTHSNVMIFTSTFGDSNESYNFDLDLQTAVLTVQHVKLGESNETYFNKRIDNTCELNTWNQFEVIVRNDQLNLKINEVEIFQHECDKPFCFSFDTGGFTLKTLQSGRYSAQVKVRDFYVEPVIVMTNSVEFNQSIYATRYLNVNYDDILFKPIYVGQDINSNSAARCVYPLYFEDGNNIYMSHVDPVLKHPLSNMTANTQYGYVASASSSNSIANYAFDSSNERVWSSLSNYSSNLGAYTSNQVTVVDGSNYPGEWIQLQLPYSMYMYEYAMKPSSNFYATSSPSTFYLVGSSNNADWILLDAQSNLTWTSNAKSFNYVPTEKYDSYRFIISKVGNPNLSNLALTSNISAMVNEITLSGIKEKVVASIATDKANERLTLACSNEILLDSYITSTNNMRAWSVTCDDNMYVNKITTTGEYDLMLFSPAWLTMTGMNKVRMATRSNVEVTASNMITLAASNIVLTACNISASNLAVSNLVVNGTTITNNNYITNNSNLVVINSTSNITITSTSNMSFTTTNYTINAINTQINPSGSNTYISSKFSFERLGAPYTFTSYSETTGQLLGTYTYYKPVSAFQVAPPGPYGDTYSMMCCTNSQSGNGAFYNIPSPQFVGMQTGYATEVSEFTYSMYYGNPAVIWGSNATLDFIMKSSSIAVESGAKCASLSTGGLSVAGNVLSGGQVEGKSIKINGTSSTGTPDTYASLSIGNSNYLSIEAYGYTPTNKRHIILNPVGSNVGIGTTSPAYKLDVNGDTIGNWFRSRGTNGWYSETYGGGWFMQDTTWIRAVANKNVWTNGSICCGTSMGVGNSSPAYTLDVSGDIRATGYIRPSAGSGNNGIIFPNDPGGGSGDIAYIKYYARSGEAMTLEIGVPNDGDDHIYLNPGGNVGIGTNAPGYKLDVNGNARVTGNLYVQTIPFGDRRNMQWDDTNGLLYYDNSSQRYKCNIQNLNEDFHKILELTPKTYNRPASFCPEGADVQDYTSRLEVGFIAEQVESLGLENILYRDKEGRPDGINYIKMAACYYQPLIKELFERVKSLEQQLANITL
jgi:hypothetical protein